MSAPTVTCERGVEGWGLTRHRAVAEGSGIRHAASARSETEARAVAALAWYRERLDQLERCAAKVAEAHAAGEGGELHPLIDDLRGLLG